MFGVRLHNESGALACHSARLVHVPIESRFDAYLDTMLLSNRKDIRLPLQNMNPMAKSHIPVLLDKCLSVDAEGIAENVVEETLASCVATADGQIYADLSNDDRNLRLGLVFADDAKGGWTDRIDVEFKNVFQNHGLLCKRGWIEVLLWSSDSDASSRESVEVAIELGTLQQQQQQVQMTALEHSQSARSLGDVLSQEAWVWKRYNKNHGQSTTQTNSLGTLCHRTLNY